jgi:hypothetical protein
MQMQKSLVQVLIINTPKLPKSWHKFLESMYQSNFKTNIKKKLVLQQNYHHHARLAMSLKYGCIQGIKVLMMSRHN